MAKKNDFVVTLVAKANKGDAFFSAVEVEKILKMSGNNAVLRMREAVQTLLDSGKVTLEGRVLYDERDFHGKISRLMNGDFANLIGSGWMTPLRGTVGTGGTRGKFSCGDAKGNTPLEAKKNWFKLHADEVIELSETGKKVKVPEIIERESTGGKVMTDFYVCGEIEKRCSKFSEQQIKKLWVMSHIEEVMEGAKAPEVTKITRLAFPQKPIEKEENEEEIGNKVE